MKLVEGKVRIVFSDHTKAEHFINLIRLAVSTRLVPKDFHYDLSYGKFINQGEKKAVVTLGEEAK